MVTIAKAQILTLQFRKQNEALTLFREHFRQVSSEPFRGELLKYHQRIAAAMYSERVVADSGGLQKGVYLSGKICTTAGSETEWVETLERRRRTERARVQPRNHW